jgi:hypothetical protein
MRFHVLAHLVSIYLIAATGAPVAIAQTNGTPPVSLAGGPSYSSGGSSNYSATSADLNGDGKPDLVVANYCQSTACTIGSVGVLLGNGDGTFQPAVTYSSGGYAATSVAVADVNGDGKPDIIVANVCVAVVPGLAK